MRTREARQGAQEDRSLLYRDLVRFATLAPSSHNTQCWTFALHERAIAIVPDFSRRCPAVDPDDHHLFVSLGCAAENLMQAALANGLRGDVAFDGASTEALTISLTPTTPVVSPLFEAIPSRQCTRGRYDGAPLSSAELELLAHAGTGDGVHVMLITEKTAMERILDYVVEANAAQMKDPAFIKELKTWIRFSDAEAVRTGDGLASRSTGNPSVPRWLGSLLFPALFRTGAENDKYATHIRSSAGMAVFVSEANTKAHWIEAGRCYERFALQATALGIRNTFVNQPVEVSTLRPQFAAHLGLGARRPDLVVRFGRGPAMPRSLRRPTDAVIV